MSADRREPSEAARAVPEERHASWLELFFDLVVVAGIGQLAHLLRADASGGGIAIYALAFSAFWLVWACFTAYSNIVGEAVHSVAMFAGMACLGVMTAAVPEIHGEHATAFAVAYVVGRLVAARPWKAATVVVDLPIVQAGFGVVPWVVSWWFHGPTQYVLWAVGLAVDVGALLLGTRDSLVRTGQRRLDSVLASLSSRGRPATRHGEALPTTVQVADADVPHLVERLSLFVLIVLGESLIQVIDGASEATWDRRLAVTALGAFLLIVGLWLLAVRRGFAGVALLPPDSISRRFAWLAHLVTTGALATMAAVLADLVGEPGERVVDHDRWLVLAAFGSYGLFSALVHLLVAWRSRGHAVVRRIALRRATAIGVPVLAVLLLGGLRADPMASHLVWLLAGGTAVIGAWFGVSVRRAGGGDIRPSPLPRA